MNTFITLCLIISGFLSIVYLVLDIIILNVEGYPIKYSITDYLYYKNYKMRRLRKKYEKRSLSDIKFIHAELKNMQNHHNKSDIPLMDIYGNTDNFYMSGGVILGKKHNKLLNIDDIELYIFNYLQHDKLKHPHLYVESNNQSQEIKERIKLYNELYKN